MREKHFVNITFFVRPSLDSSLARNKLFVRIMDLISEHKRRREGRKKVEKFFAFFVLFPPRAFFFRLFKLNYVRMINHFRCQGEAKEFVVFLLAPSSESTERKSLVFLLLEGAKGSSSTIRSQLIGQRLLIGQSIGCTSDAEGAVDEG